jgi:hypothetical protein
MPGMRRREFIMLLGGAAAGWPVGATPEQAGKVYTIGVLALMAPLPDRLIAALRQGLREAGYIEGSNLRLEIRASDAKPELLAEKAAELIRLQVDVIVAFFTPPALAAKQETSEIPIVMAAGDPAPAPDVFIPAFAAWPAALRRPASPANAGTTASLKLTFEVDHSVGAGHHHLEVVRYSCHSEIPLLQ